MARDHFDPRYGAWEGIRRDEIERRLGYDTTPRSRERERARYDGSGQPLSATHLARALRQDPSSETLRTPQRQGAPQQATPRRYDSSPFQTYETPAPAYRAVGLSSRTLESPPRRAYPGSVGPDRLATFTRTLDSPDERGDDSLDYFSRVPVSKDEERYPLTRSSPLTSKLDLESPSANAYPPRPVQDPFSASRLRQARKETPRPMLLQDAAGGDSIEAWQRRQCVPSRGKTLRIKLTQGNFVYEQPVPTAVSNAVQARFRTGEKSSLEFTHLRYSAATVDPDEFTPQNGFTLRQTLLQRDTQMVICITVYNEDKILLARTLHSVMRNIRDIQRMKSGYWKKCAERGEDAWQKILVVLVFDGIEPADLGSLDLLQTLGVYQDAVMKKEVNSKETVAHIFEYTTQLSMDSTLKLIEPQGTEKDLCPVQMCLILKAKNSKKINSHRWLFHAICRQVTPEVCVLLDAGTKPGKLSIYNLWQAFYQDDHIGGACGEIHAMLESGKKLLNPLIAAQNFEYKISNILDKPSESCFGYISVLPGAFSAYRYQALIGAPLTEYFNGDHTLAARLGPDGINGFSIFKSNIYLAEDRVLCFQLIAKRKEAWRLIYVKSAKAETDCPATIDEFISQRRRWSNGSFAAGVYALVHFWRIYQSGHNPIRIFFLHLQTLYNIFVLVFSWFALANLWLTLSVILSIIAAPCDPATLPGCHPPLFGAATVWINLVVTRLYLVCLGSSIVLALGNRPKGSKVAYTVIIINFAVTAAYLVACCFVLTVRAFQTISFKQDRTALDFLRTLLSGTSGVLVAALVATFGIYFLASLIALDVLHMFTSFVQFILLAPSMTNVLNVYAFANLHDVSWGTKGATAKDEVLPNVTVLERQGEGHDASVGSGAATVENTIKDQTDLDRHYQDTVRRALLRPGKAAKKRERNRDDENRTFRTNLILLWLITNAFLAAVVTYVGSTTTTTDGTSDATSQRQANYFSFILWATFGIAAFRFIAFIAYTLATSVKFFFRRR